MTELATQIDEVTDQLRCAGCVFAEDEAQILVDSASDDAELRDLVDARRRGEPLESIVGWVQFDGLKLHTRPGVFVPRARTRALVAAAADEIASRQNPMVVDMCCGSGAIAAALIATRGARLQMHACDVDVTAISAARVNLDGRAQLWCGDLFDALPQRLCGHFDVVVANAPYVPTEAIALMPREARDHEPTHALDGGTDGVAIHRRIAAHAPQWLTETGTVILETSRDQARLTSKALQANNFRTTIIRDEDFDATVVVGCRSA